MNNKVENLITKYLLNEGEILTGKKRKKNESITTVSANINTPPIADVQNGIQADLSFQRRIRKRNKKTLGKIWGQKNKFEKKIDEFISEDFKKSKIQENKKISVEDFLSALGGNKTFKKIHSLEKAMSIIEKNAKILMDTFDIEKNDIPFNEIEKFLKKNWEKIHEI